MAQLVRNIPIVHERSLQHDVGGGGGDIGKQTFGFLDVGLVDINIYLLRETIRPGWDWSGAVQIVKAELMVREREVAFWGASPRFLVRRLTASPGSSEVYPGAASTATGQADTGVIASPAENKWLTVDITDIVEAVAPVSVLKRNGQPGGAQPNYGLRLQAFVETNDAAGNNGRSIFYGGISTTPAASRAYIRLTYLDNHQPNAPVVESPNSDGGSAVVVGSYNGHGLTLDFLFSDDDAGDVMANSELEVYGDAATDAAPGTRLAQAIGGAVQVPGLNHWSWLVNLATIPSRVNQRYRLRTMDDSGSTDRWGRWSPLADGRFFLAYQGGPPVALVMTNNPEAVHVFGTISSVDTGDFVTAAGIEAYKDTPQGTITAWAEEVTIGGSPTRADLPWAGIPLAAGDKIRWRLRLRGRDQVWGDWSAFRTTTMVVQTGPTTMTPNDVSTKLTSRTAQFTVGYTSNFDGYQYRIYRDDDLVYDSGAVTIASASSVNFNIPAGVLLFGDGATNTVEWEAAVRLTGSGTMGPFSPRHGIRVVSLPSTTVTVSA